MKFPFVLIVLLFIPLFIVGATSDESPLPLEPDEQGFIVPGIHAEYLPPPIFYEGYIPLVLEYQTPQWNKTEVTFNNWYTCVSETYPYKYSCPVAFHMNQAVVNLHVDFEQLHPAVGSIKVKKGTSDDDDTTHYDRLISSSQFCTKIQPHFATIYTNASIFEKYLRAVKRCGIEWGWAQDDDAVLVQRNISDFNYGIRTPFTRMEQNFYNTFYKNIIAPPAAPVATTNTSDTTPTTTAPTPTTGKLDFVGSAVLSNARITLQAGILSMYYAEKNRWIHATSDCVQRLIPASIVTQDKFLKALNNITNLQMFRDGRLELAIDSIAKYYTLPITDCSHTSGNMMVVRIQVPYAKKNRSKSLQLVHTHTLPFEYKGHVCRIKLNSQTDHTPTGFFQGMSHHGAHYLYEDFSGLAFPTDCKGAELCQISEYGLTLRSGGADRCASALMARNHSIIKNHCQFTCRRQDLSETPIITRIHSNQYVITGSPFTILIHCNPSSATSTNTQQNGFEYEVTSPRIGAHLINLSCNCFFSLKSTERLKILKFYGEGVCTSNETSSSNSSSYFYGDGNPLIFEKVEIIPIMPFHFAHAKETKNSVGSFYYENLSQDAKVNLADFLDEDKIEKNYLISNNNNKDSPNRRNYNGGNNEDENITQILQGAECSSLTALWIIFIITTLTIFTLQAYIIYMLRQNAKLNYPKDERILYKVPDSPIMM